MARGRLAKLEGVDRLRRLRMCRSSGTRYAMIAAVTGVQGARRELRIELASVGTTGQRPPPYASVAPSSPRRNTTGVCSIRRAGNEGFSPAN